MSGRKTAKPEPRKLSLAVQYASGAEHIPTRPQFRRWLRAGLQQDAQVTLRIVDEAEGRELNKAYRGKDYATNVLTFVYDDVPGPLCGDVVFCAPVVAREAHEQHKALHAHYAHLAVHAALHLQGYDHEEAEEAEEMERLETALMAQLGYPDPYAVTA